MENLKKGEILNIHSYKHNGKIHRSWDEALFIEENNGYAVFGNYKTLVTEADGRCRKTKNRLISIFQKIIGLI